MSQINLESISIFLNKCQDLLSPDQIKIGDDAQKIYGKNSIDYSNIIAGALLPTAQADVIQIVTLANQYKVKLYPISTGHNWGYGGPTPHDPHSVILDLHNMNRIISVDPELGIAKIEPGVTTGQLFDYLTTHKLDFMVPVTGAGPSNSLIGNALERGFGLTPTSDHFQGIMSITAILADGRIYCSAFTHNTASDIGHLYKWGVGPYLDGLFGQGNFGIVTQATIALAPRPKSGIVFSMDLNGYYPDDAVHFIRNINKIYGKNISPVSLMNKNRMISSNPFVNPNTQSDWKVIGIIYGDKNVVRSIKKGIKKESKSIFIRRQFYNLKQIITLGNFCQKLPTVLTSMRFIKFIQYIKIFAQYALGTPTEAFVQHVAYSGQGISPLNPDQDDIGVMWYAPIIPLRNSSIRQFLDMAEPILKNYQFEFSITFISLGWHCVDGTLLLKYNRMNPADCTRAKQCYEALFKAGVALGFIPYRVGLQGMQLLVDDQTPFWQIAKEIKDVLDPNHIISSGRYNLS